MSWCKLENTYRDHRKFRRAAETLGIRKVEVRGHISTLWSWALDHAPDGCLGDLDAREIEQAAEWEGRPGALLTALIGAKLIDQTPYGLELHGWKERAGSWREAQRAKRRRKHDTQNVQAPNSYRQETGSVQYATPPRPGRSGTSDNPECADSRGSDRIQPLSDPDPAAVEERRGSDQIQNKKPDPSDLDPPERLALAPTEPPSNRVLTFPCRGKPREWHLTEATVKSLGEAYPGIDILLQAKKALAWIDASPDRHKTAKGYQRFLIRWLNNAVDRGPARGPGGPPNAPGSSPAPPRPRSTMNPETARLARLAAAERAQERMPSAVRDILGGGKKDEG